MVIDVRLAYVQKGELDSDTDYAGVDVFRATLKVGYSVKVVPASTIDPPWYPADNRFRRYFLGLDPLYDWLRVCRESSLNTLLGNPGCEGWSGERVQEIHELVGELCDNVYEMRTRIAAAREEREAILAAAMQAAETT